MLSNYAFFTFSHLADRSKHPEFNEWHQLDHRPENLALPGIAWGERWVRTPECRALGAVADSSLDGVEYLNMYWLREPLDRSVADFTALGEQCVQWGRRPDLGYAVRNLMGYFRAVRAYVDPGVLVSAEALPFRPTRGIYVTLNRAVGEPGSALDELYAWYDRVRVPDLVSCPGVSGACTFVSDSTRSGGEVCGVSPGLRLHLYYLDLHPREVATTVQGAIQEWTSRGRDMDRSGSEVPVFEGWFETIEPWRWDWFDERR